MKSFVDRLHLAYFKIDFHCSKLSIFYSFLQLTNKYPIVYVYNNYIYLLSADGQLGYFYLLAIMNYASINIYEEGFVQTYFHFSCIYS